MKTVITWLGLLSTTISITLTGCGASKVSQCNDMVKVANQAASMGQELSTLATSKDLTKTTQSFTTTAGKLEKLSKEMQALEIKDEKLKGFQSRFVKMYQATNKGLTETASALQKKNPSAIRNALTTITAGAGQESALVSEVNSYCSAK